MTTRSQDEILYGRTPQGQMLYDFGFAKLTDKWLARKHGIGAVRETRAKVRKILHPKRKRKPSPMTLPHLEREAK